LAACNGILEIRDAALAAAEAMGLSYEVLGLFSAGLTLLLAVIRAIWVHYRGTPFVVDRIDQLTIFNSIYFKYFIFHDFVLEAESFIHYFIRYFFILLCLSKTQPFMHYSTVYIIFVYFIYIFFYSILSWSLTGLWSGWWWGSWTSSSPSTGGRWCGSPPSATPSSPWVVVSTAASPPRACRYLYILIFYVDSCIKLLGLLFSKS
jgi:hypothetical protein